MYIMGKNFGNTMEYEVLPYLDERKQTGHTGRTRKRQLYYEIYGLEEPKGTIVMVHGFSECTEKMKEAAYYFLKQGYQVLLYDQAGHGKSYRFVKGEPSLIHINAFEEYVIDLHHIVHGIAKQESKGKPIYLYGHSMGGAVVAYYLELYPKSVTKAVLSSPMLRIKFKNIPELPIRMYCGFMVRRGKKFGYTSKKRYDGKKRFEDSSSNCKERWSDYQSKVREKEEYHTCVASYGWTYQSIRACKRITSQTWEKKIQADVLLCQAGKETKVENKAQDRFIKRIKKGTLKRYPESKHEIFSSDGTELETYWDTIFDFFEI